MSKVCKSCGAARSEDSAFCSSCGASFSTLRPFETKAVNKAGIPIRKIAIGGLCLIATAGIYFGHAAYADAKTKWFMPMSLNGQCGYATYGGQFVGNPAFERTGFYNANDFAYIFANGQWRFSHERGKYLLDGREEAYKANAGASAVDEYWLAGRTDGRISVYIDGNAMRVGPSPLNADDTLSDEYKRISTANGFGYTDRDSKVIIPPRYDDATKFSGYEPKAAGVMRGLSWGFVSGRGAEIGKFEYEAIQGGRDSFRDHGHIWALRKGGRWGAIELVDENAKTRKMNYEDLSPDEQVRNVRIKPVLNFDFDYLLPLSNYDAKNANSNAVFLAQKAGKWMLIDKAGVQVGGGVYDDISVPIDTGNFKFFTAMAAGRNPLALLPDDQMVVIVVRAGDRWGIIDLTGDELISTVQGSAKEPFGPPCGIITLNDALQGT